MAYVFDAHAELRYEHCEYRLMSDTDKVRSLRMIADNMSESYRNERESLSGHRVFTMSRDGVMHDWSYYIRARRRVELYGMLANAIYYRSGKCQCESVLHDDPVNGGGHCKTAIGDSEWRMDYVGAVCSYCARFCARSEDGSITSVYKVLPLGEYDPALTHTASPCMSECHSSEVRYYRGTGNRECNQCGQALDSNGRVQSLYWRGYHETDAIDNLTRELGRFYNVTYTRNPGDQPRTITLTRLMRPSTATTASATATPESDSLTDWEQELMTGGESA